MSQFSRGTTTISSFRGLIPAGLNHRDNPNSTNPGMASGHALTAPLGGDRLYHVSSLFPLPPFIPPGFLNPHHNSELGISSGLGCRSGDNQFELQVMLIPNWVNGGSNWEINLGSPNMEFLHISIENTNAYLRAMNSRVHQVVSDVPEINRWSKRQNKLLSQR